MTNSTFSRIPRGQCYQRRKAQRNSKVRWDFKRKKSQRSIGTLSTNKAWTLMKKGTKGEKLQIYLFSLRHNYKSMNAKYMTKKLEKD